MEVFFGSVFSPCQESVWEFLLECVFPLPEEIFGSVFPLGVCFLGTLSFDFSWQGKQMNYLLIISININHDAKTQRFKVAHPFLILKYGHGDENTTVQKRHVPLMNDLCLFM